MVAQTEPPKPTSSIQTMADTIPEGKALHTTNQISCPTPASTSQPSSAPQFALGFTAFSHIVLLAFLHTLEHCTVARYDKYTSAFIGFVLALLSAITFWHLFDVRPDNRARSAAQLVGMVSEIAYLQVGGYWMDQIDPARWAIWGIWVWHAVYLVEMQTESLAQFLFGGRAIASKKGCGNGNQHLLS
jgi:hypothetical protein